MTKTINIFINYDRPGNWHTNIKQKVALIIYTDRYQLM